MAAPQIMDMLVEQTHDVRHQWRNNEKGMRYTDTRLDEQQRGISLKMVPMSLVLEGASGKSFVMNLVDTPGASSRRCLVLCNSLTQGAALLHSSASDRITATSHCGMQ